MTIRFVGVAAAAAIFFFCGAREADATAYSYYNRPGADLTVLDSDLADCARTIGVISVPSMGGIILDAFARANENAFFKASMENCMVARDWRVVSVTQDEGAQWAALPRDQLNGVLASMVGAQEPHGEVVRTFSNVVMKMPNGLTAVWPFPSRFSLSDSRFDGKQLQTDSRDRELPPTQKIQFLKAISPDKAQSVPPGKVMLVIRLVAGEKGNGRMLFLARSPRNGPSNFEMAHARTAGGSGQEQVLIFIGSPGLWRLQAVVQAQTCLGTPAFEAKAGDTLFLGSFKFEDSLELDLTLPSEQVVLPADVRERMKPAKWQNGFTYPCSGLYATAVRFEALPTGDFSGETPRGTGLPVSP